MVEGVFGQAPHNNIKEGKEPINRTCAMGANPTVIGQWFDLLKKIQTEV